MKCICCAHELPAARIKSAFATPCSRCSQLSINILPVMPYVWTEGYLPDELAEPSDEEVFEQFFSAFHRLFKEDRQGRTHLIRLAEHPEVLNDMAHAGNELGRRGFSYTDLQYRFSLNVWRSSLLSDAELFSRDTIATKIHPYCPEEGDRREKKSKDRSQNGRFRTRSPQVKDLIS